MILVSIVSLLFSLLFQGLFSNFQNYTIDSLSIFSGVFLLLNLVVLQAYFENDKKFLSLLLIFGMIFDITYSNTFIFCTGIFLGIFYLNKLFGSFFPYNLFTINIFSFISMVVYHVCTFLFLLIMGFDSYSIMTLLKIIACNILMTVGYTSLMYFIINTIYKKFNLKIIRD